MEGIDYKRLDDFSGAPPSYDDVVTDPQPSAPPPGATGPPPPVHHRDPVPESSAPSAERRGETQPLNQSSSSPGSSSKLNRFVKFYTSYSMPRHLRKYVVPKSERLDPELDVEAQFAPQVVQEAQSRIEKSKRLQCVAGWLWCIGVLQIILYLLIPVGMLITGIVGFSDCPHHSNAIVVYLLLGGSIVTVLFIMRSTPSLMTCFRNRNYLNSANSSTFTGCICLFEVTFYILASANLVVLILGTVWIFQDTNVPQCGSDSSQDCCETYVYVTSAFFNVFQYAMYTFTSLYICFVAACIRNMDEVYSRR